MGQKTNPIGLRVGIIRGWDSHWFDEQNFSSKLHEDITIRKYIKTRMPNAGISTIQIERTTKTITINLHTSRPGIVIGRSGKEIDKLKLELNRLTKKDIQLNVTEIKKPEMDAHLVGENIARQLENKINFRRVMKKSIANTMRAGAGGIKILCSGRLGGHEMARKEKYMEGRVPLHTLRADIDYALCVARTTYGAIGVKVWIFKGEVLGRKEA